MFIKLIKANNFQKSSLIMQTVLIVDDDKISHKFIHKALDNKFEIIDTYSGEEGIEKVGEANPDVILLDVEMPGLNGYEVCDQLKCNEATNAIPVVFLSSHTSLRERMLGYEAGADDYLVKPFVPEDLNAKLRILANYRVKQEALQQQIKEAKDTARTAIDSTSYLGMAMKFIEKSHAISTFEGLAQAFFGVTDNFGLKCILYLENNDRGSYFSSTDVVTPLESELIYLLRQEKRLYDFGCRTQMNFPNISVLVKNMPLDNAMSYGQIKDLLPAMLIAADTKVSRLNIEYAVRMQTDEINESFNAIKGTLSEISQMMQQNQKVSAKIMRDMLTELDQNIPRMGLEQDQEDYIINRVDSAIRESADTIDAGNEFATAFKEVSGNLQGLIDKQNQLMEQIISKPIDESSEGDSQEDSYSMDVELF